MEDSGSFAQLIDAIRPWLSHLVIVGGWAHRLHRLHPLANALPYQPLLTRDADIAFSEDAPLDGDLRVALSNAGFKEDFSGDDTPPITYYRLGDEDAGFYAEFLTPLQGDGLKRNGLPDVTMEKAGISAQKLRHIDLLLLAPWSVEVGLATGLAVASKANLLVPNPVSFIVQKLLIHKDRKPKKKAHDVLYIHDTLELFGASLDQLRTTWAKQVCSAMPARTATTAMNAAKQLFDHVTDTTREAALIPQDRRPSAERIRAACEYGLGEIFGNG